MEKPIEQIVQEISFEIMENWSDYDQQFWRDLHYELFGGPEDE